MPRLAIDILIYASVGAFVLFLVGVMLSYFGVWTSQDEKTSDWARGKVVLPVVGAVAGFTVLQFSAGADEPPGDGPVPAPTSPVSISPDPINSPIPVPSTSPTQAPLTPAPSPTPALPDRPPARPNPPVVEAASCAIEHPSSLAQSAAVLGKRPNPNCAKNAPYPPCVADIASRSLGETVRAETWDCSRDLTEWRRTYIAGVLTLKAPYQTELEGAEISTRPRANEELSEWREYILAEINRLNGPSWDRFVEIDARSKQDMDRCYLNYCRASNE
ncbi:MAG: hypothetical protein WBA51_02645 [Erythrobacter sp.]